MWIELFVIDNVDKDIVFIKIGNIFLGDYVKVGIYYVNYNVEDKFGNKVEQCIVELLVEGNLINVILYFIFKGELNMIFKFIQNVFYVER